LPLCEAGVNFGSIELRVSAAKSGWLSFLDVMPLSSSEWFTLAQTSLLKSTRAWMKARAPFPDAELTQILCRGGAKRKIIIECITRRYQSGKFTDPGWRPLVECFGTLKAFQSCEELRAWLALGCNVDFCGRSGKTPLVLAVESRSLDILTEIISAGADLNVRYGADGMTALFMAVSGRWLAGVTRLIEAGADVNVRTTDGRTAVCEAVSLWSGKIVLNPLIEAGGDVNVRLSDGRTLLQFTFEKGDYELVERLLSAGADPLPAFSNAKLDAEWRSYLGRSWRRMFSWCGK
jgi:hypothetical protein